MSRRLEVLLAGRPVGQISETADGGTEFRFDDAYREVERRPVLGQKFEDDLERVHRNRPGQGLPDFFANLIPEGRLREVIEKAADLEPRDDLGLLEFVGEDLPGAVVVRPLVFGAEDLPGGRGAVTAAGDGESGEEARDALRFSVAGVQLKFSVLLEGERLVLPARDRAGEWLAKLDSPGFPRLPENELSMLRWARAAGFAVPECRLLPLRRLEERLGTYAPPSSKVLVVRRYDREPGGARIHQEDFAQAVGLPPTKKYDQITYEVMARLTRRFIDEEAVDEFVRRLALVVACGNNDAHLKNWSLLYPDGIQARWAPLYDQVATVAWPGPDRALALKLAGVKEFGRIDRGVIERFAERSGIDGRRAVDLVGETLERLRQAWREVGGDLPLPRSHADALRAHWRRVPLLSAVGGLPE